MTRRVIAYWECDRCGGLRPEKKNTGFCAECNHNIAFWVFECPFCGQIVQEVCGDCGFDFRDKRFVNTTKFLEWLMPLLDKYRKQVVRFEVGE